MKRTTIYLEPELEVRLKMEGLRRKQPMAVLVREAVEAYLTRDPVDGPPGGGGFASGHRDTADRAEELLDATGFGGDRPGSKSASAKRAARPPSRSAAGRPKRRR